MLSDLLWNWSKFAHKKRGLRPIRRASAPAATTTPALAPESVNLLNPAAQSLDPDAGGPRGRLSQPLDATHSSPVPEAHISTARKEKRESCKRRRGIKSSDQPEQPRKFRRLRLKKVSEGEEEQKARRIRKEAEEEDQKARRIWKEAEEEDQKARRIRKETVEMHKDDEKKETKKINRRKRRKAREEEEPKKETEVDSSPPSKNLRSRNKLPQKNQIKKEECSSTSGPKRRPKLCPNMKFSRTLSDKEIIDDFELMTGRLPPRRPMKTADATKYIQTKDGYPGSLLHFVQPLLYEVKENKPTAKGYQWSYR